MKHIKNFTKYIPEDNGKKELIERFNAIFLQSEDGQDWYECQESFSEETIKCMYDKTGVICAITKDVSGLYPEDKSVIEFESIPENVTYDGNWQFINNEIVKREIPVAEKIALAKKEKQILLDKAEGIIAPLKDAIELNMATDEEKEKCTEWKKYRIFLSRVDITDPDSVVWPVPPDVE